MILYSTDDTWRVVTQSDHAHFSGELLSLWFRDGLPEHERRRELLFAARQHDNGWREADAAPFCDRQTGLPHDFLSLPDDERRRIWRRGTTRFIEREPYAALLILEHALTLHHKRRREAAWHELFFSWEALKERLLVETGVDQVVLENDYRWVDLTDLLSLAACQGWRDPVERHGYRAVLREDALAVDPFPLAGATTFRIACRFLTKEPFHDHGELAIALATAHWQELVLRVVPW